MPACRRYQRGGGGTGILPRAGTQQRRLNSARGRRRVLVGETPSRRLEVSPTCWGHGASPLEAVHGHHHRSGSAQRPGWDIDPLRWGTFPLAALASHLHARARRPRPIVNIEIGPIKNNHRLPSGSRQRTFIRYCRS